MGSTRQARPFRPSLPLIGFVLVVSVFEVVLFYPETLEDAFITFRYSEHLAEGYGVGRWNVGGPPVEGYSTPLWMALLAACVALGLDCVTASKLVGGLALLAVVALLLFFPRAAAARRSEGAESDPLSREGGAAPAMAGVLIAFCLPAAWYGTSGMEVTTVILLVGAGLVGPALWTHWFATALAYGLLVLVRPEGILLAGCLAVFHMFRAYAGEPLMDGSSDRLARIPEPVRVQAIGLCVAILTQLGIFAHRWLVFDSIWPNTFYAKVSGGGVHHLELGLHYLGGWAGTHALWLGLAIVAVGAAGFRAARSRSLARQAPTLALGATVAIYIAYVAVVGGDNQRAFPHWRHFLHILPITSLLVSVGVLEIARGRRRILTLALAALVVATGAATLPAQRGHLWGRLVRAIDAFPDFEHTPPRSYITWMRDFAGPDMVIAAAGAGELPYRVDVTHIDMLGLNDREIAREGRFESAGLVDSKHDMDAVLVRRPDVIEGYIPATTVLKEMSGRPARRPSGRRQMIDEMFGHPIFRAEYAFLRNGPYDDHDRALFLRRDVCENHPRAAELDCIAVLDWVRAVENAPPR